ncbi:MAG: hypothetical protein WA309_00015, partial [Pseudolabrys sp.]
AGERNRCSSRERITLRAGRTDSRPDRRTMKYCSTLYATAEALLDRQTRLFGRRALPGKPEMASVWLDPPYTIDILHRSCNIWLIRFGMAT